MEWTGWIPEEGQAPERTWSEEKEGQLWNVEQYGPEAWRWQPAPPPGATPQGAGYAAGASPYSTGYTSRYEQQPMSPFEVWQRDFGQIHGRDPEAKDWQDKQWMDSFTQQQGRLPTREDWVRHWYSQPARSRNYAPEFTQMKSWPLEAEPLAWNMGQDRWKAFENIGFQGQRVPPEQRDIYNMSQRLIANATDWADWKARSDAIIEYLRSRRKQTQQVEPGAAGVGQGGVGPGAVEPAAVEPAALGATAKQRFPIQGEFPYPPMGAEWAEEPAPSGAWPRQPGIAASTVAGALQPNQLQQFLGQAGQQLGNIGQQAQANYPRWLQNLVASSVAGGYGHALPPPFNIVAKLAPFLLNWQNPQGLGQQLGGLGQQLGGQLGQWGQQLGRQMPQMPPRPGFLSPNQPGQGSW